jgi:hypothetical protein
MAKLPEKKPGDGLEAEHVNDLSDAARAFLGSRSGGNLTKHQGGTFMGFSGPPPWKQFNIEVTAEPENHPDAGGLYLGKIRFWDEPNGEWKTGNDEYLLDATDSKLALWVGSRLTAYWDKQRGAFVPASHEPCPWRNDGGYDIGPFEVFAITDSVVVDGQAILVGEQPSSTFHVNYGVNGAHTVTANGGYGTYQPGPEVRIVYDTGTPAVGEEYGPKAGQGTLVKGYPSICTVLGIVDSENKIALVRMKSIEYVWARLEEDLYPCGEAAAKVLIPDSNGNLCNVLWDATVYDVHDVVNESSAETIAHSHAYCRIVSTDGGLKLEFIAPGTGSCCESRCWKLTKCDTDPAEVSYTDTDMAEYDGAVVELDDGFCYEVSIADDCSESMAAVVPVAKHHACSECGYCYHLVPCEGFSPDPATKDIKDDLESITGLSGEANIGLVVKIDGVCWTVDSYDDDCSESSVTVGLTGDDVFVDCDECGVIYMLTECPDGDDTVIYTKLAVDADGEAFELGEYVDEVVRLDDGICYQVTAYDSEALPELMEVTVLEHYPNCGRCVCYLLQDCENETNTKLTYSDIAAAAPNLYLGTTVVREYSVPGDHSSSYKCWKVMSVESYAGTAEEVFVEGVYDDCPQCLLTQKYLLENNPGTEGNEVVCSACDGATNDNAAADIVTTTDLHAAVGKWIKVGGVCYYVSTTEETETQAVVEWTGPYDSCADCTAANVTTTIPFLQPTLDGSGNVTKVSVMGLVVVNGSIKAVCTIKDDISTIECPEPV